MGAQLAVKNMKNQQRKSNGSSLSTLQDLELHLSHAPARQPAKRSLLEEYFHEINYSSFGSTTPLKTSLKPRKNATCGRLTARFR